MKYLSSLKSAAAAWLLVTSVSLLAQAPAPPGGLGGPGGRGGRGGPFGPPLPPEQQALVEKFNAELTAENAAVTVASSNLVVATFSTPKDDAKIAAANQALTIAREAWATKASALFAKTQASETKLSEAAVAQLVATASGRGGRGGRGGFGGPGGPGGPGGRGGRGPSGPPPP